MRQPEGDLFDGVFDALGAGLIVLDSSLDVVGWNAWMASAAGITAEAAAGKQLEELFPGATFHRLNSAMTEALHSGASSLLTHSLHPALFPLKTRAGRNLIHDISVHPVGPKPFSRCLVQIVDVTVTAEREHVLRKRQNARYAAVVDNAPDAILTLDADGLIQFANPAATNVFHCPAPARVGRPVGELFEGQDAWLATWQAALGGEPQCRPLEFVIYRGDGTSSFVEVSAKR